MRFAGHSSFVIDPATPPVKQNDYGKYTTQISCQECGYTDTYNWGEDVACVSCGFKITHKAASYTMQIVPAPAGKVGEAQSSGLETAMQGMTVDKGIVEDDVEENNIKTVGYANTKHRFRSHDCVNSVRDLMSRHFPVACNSLNDHHITIDMVPGSTGGYVNPPVSVSAWVYDCASLLYCHPHFSLLSRFYGQYSGSIRFKLAFQTHKPGKLYMVQHFPLGIDSVSTTHGWTDPGVISAVGASYLASRYPTTIGNCGTLRPIGPYDLATVQYKLFAFVNGKTEVYKQLMVTHQNMGNIGQTFLVNQQSPVVEFEVPFTYYRHVVTMNQVQNVLPNPYGHIAISCLGPPESKDEAPDSVHVFVAGGDDFRFSVITGNSRAQVYEYPETNNNFFVTTPTQTFTGSMLPHQ